MRSVSEYSNKRRKQKDATQDDKREKEPSQLFSGGYGDVEMNGTERKCADLQAPQDNEYGRIATSIHRPESYEIEPTQHRCDETQDTRTSADHDHDGKKHEEAEYDDPATKAPHQTDSLEQKARLGRLQTLEPSPALLNSVSCDAVSAAQTAKEANKVVSDGPRRETTRGPSTGSTSNLADDSSHKEMEEPRSLDRPTYELLPIQNDTQSNHVVRDDLPGQGDDEPATAIANDLKSCMDKQTDRSIREMKEPHAIDCGASDCEQCADRTAGFDFWHVAQTGDTDDVYTTGESAFARTFDGEDNILMMIVNKDLMKDIKESVAEGRRYRATKTEIDAAAVQLQLDNRYTYPTRNLRRVALEAMKRKLAHQRQHPSAADKKLLQELQKAHAEAEHAVRVFDHSRQRLMQRARQAEQKWTSAMRKVTFHHECLLADAGVMADVPVANWNDDRYCYDSFLRSDHHTDVIPGNCNTHTDDEEDPQTSAEDGIGDESDGENRYKFHNERINACKEDVKRTQDEHDLHRHQFDQLFNDYIADHPERSKEDLARDFGPVYVEQWQERIQALKAAEEALVMARAEATAELTDPAVEAQKILEEDEALESIAQAENQRSIEEVDRPHIERWLSAHTADMEPGYVSCEDSDKLWEQPEYQIVRKDNMTSSPAPEKTCADIAQQETGKGQRVIQDNDEDADAAANSAFNTQVKTQDMHANAASVKLLDTCDRVRIETALTPRFGSGDFANAPHIENAFVDNVSVFETHRPWRRDIDEWAKKVRDGFY